MLVSHWCREARLPARNSFTPWLLLMTHMQEIVMYEQYFYVVGLRCKLMKWTIYTVQNGNNTHPCIPVYSVLTGSNTHSIHTWWYIGSEQPLWCLLQVIYNNSATDGVCRLQKVVGMTKNDNWVKQKWTTHCVQWNTKTNIKVKMYTCGFNFNLLLTKTVPSGG